MANMIKMIPEVKDESSCDTLYRALYLFHTLREEDGVPTLYVAINELGETFICNAHIDELSHNVVTVIRDISTSQCYEMMEDPDLFQKWVAYGTPYTHDSNWDIYRIDLYTETTDKHTLL